MNSGATRSSWVAAGLAVLALQAGIANAADPAAAKSAAAVAPAREIDADALAVLKKFGGFLAAQPQFTVESQRLLLPFVERVDGAFVARLRLT